MVQLKPKIRVLLQEILETARKGHEYGHLHKKNNERINSLYVIDDVDAYNKHKAAVAEIERQKLAEIQKIFESDATEEERFDQAVQMSEKYDKLYSELPKYAKYIPSYNKKEFEQLESENETILELRNIKEDEENNLLDLLDETIIEEYGLKDKIAKIGECKDQKQKLYYNPRLVADDRSFSEIFFNMIYKGFNFHDHSESGVGLSLLLENLEHLKSFPDEPGEFLPEFVAEVAIDKNAKLHYISQEDYENESCDEFEEYFDPEDYELLKAVQEESFGFYRCLFDIAMGFDGTVVVYPDSEKRLYAIYNRSVLEVKKQPIKNLEALLEEGSMNK